MAPSERDRLMEMVRNMGLGRIFADPEDLVRRVAEFAQQYRARAGEAPRGSVPPDVDIPALLLEYEANAHRVKALFQALAFACTSTMLAMIWMVEHGATIETLEFHYELRASAHLAVTVGFDHSRERLRFESDEPWDAAVLRLVGISKVDGAPMLDGFYALKLSEPAAA